jgi:hypothetical protein
LFNIKVSFIEEFGTTRIIAYNRELIYSSKQREDETLMNASERFRDYIYATEHIVQEIGCFCITSIVALIMNIYIHLLDVEAGKAFI